MCSCNNKGSCRGGVVVGDVELHGTESCTERRAPVVKMAVKKGCLQRMGWLLETGWLYLWGGCRG